MEQPKSPKSFKNPQFLCTAKYLNIYRPAKIGHTKEWLKIIHKKLTKSLVSKWVFISGLGQLTHATRRKINIKSRRDSAPALKYLK
jgi:hypothetical protein